MDIHYVSIMFYLACCISNNTTKVKFLHNDVGTAEIREGANMASKYIT